MKQTRSTCCASIFCLPRLTCVDCTLFPSFFLQSAVGQSTEFNVIDATLNFLPSQNTGIYLKITACRVFATHGGTPVAPITDVGKEVSPYIRDHPPASGNQLCEKRQFRKQLRTVRWRTALKQPHSPSSDPGTQTHRTVRVQPFHPT